MQKSPFQEWTMNEPKESWTGLQWKNATNSAYLLLFFLKVLPSNDIEAYYSNEEKNIYEKTNTNFNLN